MSRVSVGWPAAIEYELPDGEYEPGHAFVPLTVP